ncbi:hypothetical protein JHK87_047932 [Glycine soja]|nr:hypothetical protein JHK87_047932 [Glycine soja]
MSYWCYWGGIYAPKVVHYENPSKNLNDDQVAPSVSYASKKMQIAQVLDIKLHVSYDIRRDGKMVRARWANPLVDYQFGWMGWKSWPTSPLWPVSPNLPACQARSRARQKLSPIISKE